MILSKGLRRSEILSGPLFREIDVPSTLTETELVGESRDLLDDLRILTFLDGKINSRLLANYRIVRLIVELGTEYSYVILF